MEDREIIDLYWRRDEEAIVQTQIRYGGLLTKLAYAILYNWEDCEETVNDAYLRTWRSIPQDRPQYFAAYLSKILRRLAVDRYRRNTAVKRGGAEYAASLEELADCVPGGEDPADEAERAALTESVNRFLSGETAARRAVFLQRYFYALSVREIAEKNSMTESNVRVTLSRMRGRLREQLEQEGY